MSSKHVNTAISLLALGALARLWSAGGLVWWAILMLMLTNMFVGAVVGKALEIESKVFVVRLWRRMQLLVNVVCFLFSMGAIVASFR